MKRHDPDREFFWLLFVVFSFACFAALTHSYYLWMEYHGKRIPLKPAPEIVWPPKK